MVVELSDSFSSIIGSFIHFFNFFSIARRGHSYIRVSYWAFRHYLTAWGLNETSNYGLVFLKAGTPTRFLGKRVPKAGTPTRFLVKRVPKAGTPTRFLVKRVWKMYYIVFLQRGA